MTDARTGSSLLSLLLAGAALLGAQQECLRDGMYGRGKFSEAHELEIENFLLFYTPAFTCKEERRLIDNSGDWEDQKRVYRNCTYKDDMGFRTIFVNNKLRMFGFYVTRKDDPKNHALRREANSFFEELRDFNCWSITLQR